MSTPDSRTSQLYLDSSPYINSNPPPYTWGQLPASYFEIRVINGIIIGEPIQEVYIPTVSDEEQLNEIDSDLKLELNSWEALGIEDWLNFDSTLE